jgi:peroxiredoxin
MNIGEKAPDFALPATNGETFTLSGFRRRCRVVLLFMREFG